MSHSDKGNSSSTGYLIWICLVATLGGLLFGYDTGVISGANVFFNELWDLSAEAQGWATSSALVGCVIGSLIAGQLSDRFGRKRSLILSAFLFAISAILSAPPRNVDELAIARIIGGVGVGIASILSPLYIAEISPARLRGRLVSLNQLAIVSGFLVVYFANAGIQGLGDEDWNRRIGWRIMFGSETLPAALFIILLFFVPESPRWLVKQGRSQEALRILTCVSDEESACREVIEIEDAIAHEGGGSYAEFLKPGLMKALILAVALAILQQITGINSILYYGVDVFRNAGAGTNVAFMQTVLVGVVNVAFTVLAIFMVDKVGRKPLLFFGSISMCFFITMTAICFHFELPPALTVIFVLGYIASFASSLGPVVWVYISEIFPTQIRGRAMAIATLTLWIACLTVSWTFPVVTEYFGRGGNVAFGKAVPFYFYGAMCAMMAFVSGVFMRETKGHTLEEIERWWLNGK